MTYILRKRRTKPMLKGKRLCTSGAIMSDETLSGLIKKINYRYCRYCQKHKAQYYFAGNRLLENE